MDLLLSRPVLWLAGLFVCAASCASFAQAPASASGSRPVQTSATEAFLKGVIEQRLRVPHVDSVTRLPFIDLYEARIGNDVIYIDSKGDHVFVGNIIETRSRQNLTKARTDALVEAATPKIKYAELPFNSAIKFVKGNGKRQLVVFSDPNCTFCKRLEKTLEGVTDVTMHVFLYPILGADSVEKSKSIWCSPDRAKAWSEWMLSGTVPTAAGNCNTPLTQLLALGKSLGVEATPTMVFVNGRRVPGALPAEELQKLLTKAS